MEIRACLGYVTKGNLSQVDHIVDEILSGFYSISNSFVKGQEVSNLEELAAIVKNDFNNEIYIGFVNWFKQEGYDFFVNTAKFLYEDDVVLTEELDYLKFIINSESKNGVDNYPSDVIGSLVDISDQMVDLLKKANVSLELSRLYNF